MEKKKLIILGMFLLVLIPIISASDFGYDNPNLPRLEPKKNITYITYYINETNDTIYWDGNAWSDTRWLNIDGSNANTNIDLGGYNITNIGKLILQGVITSQDIIPITTNLYTLGNSTNWFKELYAKTIYSENITADYLNSTNIEAKDINTDDLNSGNVNISENLTISGYELKEREDNFVIILT